MENLQDWAEQEHLKQMERDAEGEPETEDTAGTGASGAGGSIMEEMAEISKLAEEIKRGSSNV